MEQTPCMCVCSGEILTRLGIALESPEYVHYLICLFCMRLPSVSCQGEWIQYLRLSGSEVLGVFFIMRFPRNNLGLICICILPYNARRKTGFITLLLSWLLFVVVAVWNWAQTWVVPEGTWSLAPTLTSSSGPVLYRSSGFPGLLLLGIICRVFDFKSCCGFDLGL